MEFRQVSERLATEDPQLSILPLNALKPAREFYKELLLQPGGDITASEKSIANSSPKAVLPAYLDFLRLAVSSNADLVATPEYCIPWDVIENIENGSYAPPEGSLWILGCESISQKQLVALKARLLEKGIKVIYDLPADTTGSFFCPLCYVFWAEDPQLGKHLCILVQFKIVPSGGKFIELDNLIPGNTIFVFGEKDQELNLFTLICADVNEFSAAKISHLTDTIIFHIQLNEKPWDTSFSQYRNEIYARSTNNRIQLQCLNWASGISITNGKKKETWTFGSSSGFYISTNYTKDIKDEDIDELHKKGLYLNSVNDFWDVFFLHSSAQAILMNKKRVRFDGNQNLKSRYKIKIEAKYISNGASFKKVRPADIDDGFLGLVAETKPMAKSKASAFNAFLNNISMIHKESPLAVERCFELLQGPSGQPENWYDRNQLGALKIGPCESSLRVTNRQENKPDTSALEGKRTKIQAGFEASELHQEKGFSWPHLLKDLSQGINYSWNQDAPHFNVTSKEAEKKRASILYFTNYYNDKEKNYYSMIEKGIKDHIAKTCSFEEMLEESIRAKDRLCVVYRSGSRSNVYHNPDGKDFRNEGNRSPTNIFNEGDNGY